jgi:lipopolysaccharide transport system permease protein
MLSEQMQELAYSSTNRVSTLVHLMPWGVFKALWKQRELICQLTWRDVLIRYKGSFLGVFSSLIKPLSLLAIYTVVFGFIFESKFQRQEESADEFALALFAGLMVFEFFAESISRAPTLILSSPNYVTKVVFPLEVLPISVVGGNFAHLLIDAGLLLAGMLVWRHSLPITALQAPLLLIPLVLFTLGSTWFLSSLGVFLRDIQALLRPLVMILMYASAIFYPPAKVPMAFRPLVDWNPLSVMIEQVRRTILWGMPLEWEAWAFVTGCAVIVFFGGYAFFMRSKHAFADVM